ncbi:hypothetical protein AB1L16_07890 [Peribacillus frigoritolerans]|uniref:hypothetical protein n=1 Tax=Peribacillus frigoritolerans TaxID=450367 RepID=UPI0039A094C5
MSEISEALLEMYYFHPIKDAIESVLGKKINRIYKPSPQEEAWLGFDQAWVNDQISEEDFYEMIKERADKKSKPPYKKDRYTYIAFLLQFKVVEKKERIIRSWKGGKLSFRIPPKYTTPYYRSPLKTEPSKTAKYAQHNLLYEINKKFKNFGIYYACPMLFEQKDIFVPKVDLDKLILVDLDSAPSPYKKKWRKYNNHHIMFQDTTGKGMKWCSRPQKGTSFSSREWIEQKVVNSQLDSEGVLALIKDLVEFEKDISLDKKANNLIDFFEYRKFISCLKILEIDNEDVSKETRVKLSDKLLPVKEDIIKF